MGSDDVHKVITVHFKHSWRTRQELKQNLLPIPKSPADPLLAP